MRILIYIHVSYVKRILERLKTIANVKTRVKNKLISSRWEFIPFTVCDKFNVLLSLFIVKPFKIQNKILKRFFVKKKSVLYFF